MISIIVPIYNVEQYLIQCLESILNQTCRDIEIILIDDGSQDCCGEICDEYARKDNRIKVYHTNNGGLAAARNYGIEKATGEYIGFADSDDWIEPDMFEVLLSQAEKHKAEIAICGCYYEYLGKTETSSVMQNGFELYDNRNLINALVSGAINNGV